MQIMCIDHIRYMCSDRRYEEGIEHDAYIWYQCM